LDSSRLSASQLKITAIQPARLPFTPQRHSKELATIEVAHVSSPHPAHPRPPAAGIIPPPPLSARPSAPACLGEKTAAVLNDIVMRRFQAIFHRTTMARPPILVPPSAVTAAQQLAANGTPFSPPPPPQRACLRVTPHPPDSPVQI
jgi:hypothetical protein